MTVNGGRGVAAGRVLLELLFPGRCVLCGNWIDPAADTDAPVCASCFRRLVVERGPRCQRCGVPLVSEHTVCMRCREVERAFAGSFALFPDRGDARTLLRALKFDRRARLAPFFARMVAAELGRLYPGAPVVPVPPRRGRGEPDAVERICRVLEGRHSITVSRILRRRGGEQQKSLDYDERARNLRGRIRVVGSRSLPDVAVLFDDVFTTGATLDACARALKAEGVRTVQGLTLLIEE